MAKQDIHTHLDLRGNELQNFSAQGLSTAPANPTERQIYFNTETKLLMMYVSGEWKAIGKDYNAGSKISLENGTFKHETTATTRDTSSASASYGDNGVAITAIDVVETDAYGHVTKVTTKTITISKPAVADVTGLQTALDGKVTKTSAASSLYGTDASGNVANPTYGTGIGAGYIVQRDAGGEIMVPLTPNASKPNAAVSKSFTEGLIAEVNDRIDEITAFGRYLTDWDPTAKVPNVVGNTETNIANFPNTADGVYKLKSGDYFLINKDSATDDNGELVSDDNYAPAEPASESGWKYAQGDEFARERTTVVYKAGGKFRFDGTKWNYTAPDHHFDLESFTNSQLGGIKGHQADGYVEKGDTNGTAKVHGWDGVLKNNDPRLGNAAWKNVGTAAGTVAAGDHSHSWGDITGKPQIYPTRRALTFTADGNSSDYVAVLEGYRTAPIVFNAQDQQVSCLVTLTGTSGTENYAANWKISINADSAPTGWYAMIIPA